MGERVPAVADWSGQGGVWTKVQVDTGSRATAFAGFGEAGSTRELGPRNQGHGGAEWCEWYVEQSPIHCEDAGVTPVKGARKRGAVGQGDVAEC